jgi:hypothetical protein
MGFKMVLMDELLANYSIYIEQGHCVNEVNKCSNCSKMKNYLKVLTTELKSEQSIINILMEELNMDNRNNVASSVESGNTQAPHHINVRNSLSDYVWTEVRKKSRSTNLQNHIPRRSKHIKEYLSTELPLANNCSIPVSNRFLPLDNRYEPQEKILDLHPTGHTRPPRNIERTRLHIECAIRLSRIIRNNLSQL